MLDQRFSAQARWFSQIFSLLATLAAASGSEIFAQDPAGSPTAKPGNSQLVPPPIEYVADGSASKTLGPNDNWNVVISPGQKSPEINGKNYQSVYNSIPYRRSEYLANPSYRHDTTMEILFGEMRPTVIQRNDTPQRIVNPRPSMYRPYFISRGEMYGLWPYFRNPYAPLVSPYYAPLISPEIVP